uniref:WD repeat-containing protein 54 beta-propeller domain-containing protein n=1 Tax=Strigamia maritima TaxID=126957 RepID=T1IZ78_STRMM
MYTKDETFILRSSASAIPNNLSCNWSDVQDGIHIAVIHKNTANILNVNKNGEQSYEVCSRDSTSLILQAKWCVIGNNLVLVIASQEGVRFYDSDGTLIHWHPFSNQEDTLAIDTFARGITSLNNYVYVGTHEGLILAFRANPVSSLGKEQPYTLKFHASPITHMCSWNSYLVSADDSGCICIWRNDDNATKKLHSFDAFGFPCTSIAAWHELIVAGFSSGHLRVFSLQTLMLCTEVVGHARCITSVDVAASGLTLSASEDSFVRVWQLINEVKQKSIQFRCTILVPDYQLFGACFLNNSGTKIGVTAYDSEEVFCYKLINE